MTREELVEQYGVQRSLRDKAEEEMSLIREKLDAMGHGEPRDASYILLDGQEIVAPVHCKSFFDDYLTVEKHIRKSYAKK